MDDIKLTHNQWKIDFSTRLGKAGGFGEVYKGLGSEGPVAIKRLKITAAQAAHRELSISETLMGKDLSHVVPVLDFGQDAESDRYYIVMPLCDGDLQSFRESNTLSHTQTIEILAQIFMGLAEVSGITHRDLKPANILLHNGVWKLADFGISKFVSDATSLESLRSYLTPSYASPEQWQNLRPTEASDVYSVGCIAHFLTLGHPPFEGDLDAVAAKHLLEVPQKLTDLPLPLQSLVSSMLRKSPETRPSQPRCLAVLSAAHIEVPAQRQGIAAAVSQIAQEQAKQEALDRTRKDRAQSRDLALKEGLAELKGIKERLFTEIYDSAADVLGQDRKIISGARLQLHHAILKFETSLGNGQYSVHAYDHQDHFGSNGWGAHTRQSSWDFLAIGNLSLEQRNGQNVVSRDADLILARPNEATEYRWYEVAFWTMGRKTKPEPFALSYPWEIDKALAPIGHINNVAYGPVPIDAENEPAFIDYWVQKIGQAAIGQLERLGNMPMRDR